MKKKILIFDFDGVLFDSPKLVSKFFLSLYPTMTQKIINELLCGNFIVELEKFKLENKPVEETPEEREARSLAYSARKLKVPLYKDIKEMLEMLHGMGHVLTINTSALGKNCLPLLQYSGIEELFDFVGTKEVAASKVEKFRIIKDKYSVIEEDMIFITDTLGDIREADEARVPTIAVTWGAHDRSYFNREPHENLIKIVDSVSELEVFLK